MALHPGASNRVRRVDRDPRRSISRATRILRAPEQGLRAAPERKFFYLFTCEYCFSHYVTAIALVITRFTLLFPGWRGYLLAGFWLVWIANFYMSVFGRLRLDIREERLEIEIQEAEKDAQTKPSTAGWRR